MSAQNNYPDDKEGRTRTGKVMESLAQVGVGNERVRVKVANVLRDRTWLAKPKLTREHGGDVSEECQ